MEYLLYIAVIAIFVILIVKKKNKEKASIESGDMIQREKAFFKQEHIFKTHINSIDEIYNALNLDALKRNEIEYSLTTGKLIQFDRYKLGQGMTSSLTAIEKNDDYCMYKYSVNRFTTYNSMEQGYMEANIALTQIEKAIFGLDASAQVERKVIAFKTTF